MGVVDDQVLTNAYPIVSATLEVFDAGIRAIAKGASRPVGEVASKAISELVRRVSGYGDIECSKLSEMTVEKINEVIQHLEQIRDALKED